MNEVMEQAKKIRLVIFDVDGVLTDGKLYIDHKGHEFKCFHVRDGHGMKMLRQSGVEVAVISGRCSESVEMRMKDLGIDHVYQGQEDKVAALEELCARLSVTHEQVAHVGDDLLDLPVMQRVGLSIAVNDANFAVRERARWVTENNGGDGAVREVCDFLMRAQNTLDSAIAAYL